jgi:CDP-glucose 4,6-dehydratase
MAKILRAMGAYVYGVDLQSWWNPLKAFDSPGMVFNKIVMGDVRDYNTCERVIVEVKPKVIFHLAAVTQVVDFKQMPLQAYWTNILGTANVLEAARRAFPGEVVTVVASSDKAYGSGPGTLMANERTFLNPVHPYDVSKASADFIARSYGKFYGERTAITRCGNVYGPGDSNWQRIVPGTIRDYLLGKVPVIRSDGSLVREYNYVDDIIDAYLLVAESLMGTDPVKTGRAWTISDASGRMTVLDMVYRIREAITEINPKVVLPSPTILGTANDEGKEIRLSSSAISEMLGWFPRVSIRDGLLETVKWLMDAYLMPPPSGPEALSL